MECILNLLELLRFNFEVKPTCFGNSTRSKVSVFVFSIFFEGVKT